MDAHRPSYRALYLQVRDTLVKRIALREWMPGHAIPNENELAREFGVSSGTVRKALELMEAERLIMRRQGKGTFVSEVSTAVVADRFVKLLGTGGERLAAPTARVTIVTGHANEQERLRLRLSADDLVHRFRRTREDGRGALAVEDVALPAALFPGLTNQNDVDGSLGALARSYGVLLGRADERIALGTAPTADVADTLGVALETPLMLLDRVIFTLNGRPAQWRMAWCHLRGSFYLAAIG
ncbi:MAG TPA: GntR family transcriptional regulator [Hyphomicrobiaceae bacterium]|nr:GntR family transcriptional regulator [Hyphomicrobiaceae bacterium]